MKTVLSLILCLLAALPISAQEDPEYRMEIGAAVGIMGYLGDYNDAPTKNLQPAAGVLARYIFNSYSGLKLSATYGKIKGSSENVETYYPDYATTPYQFNNTIVDVSLTYEHNFLPYGTGRDYRGAKRLSPFVFAGLGATYVNTDNAESKSVFTANLPIGIGVKYKINQRTNLGLEWAIHFSLSDELDGSKDPYYVKSSGPFKNTDCYTALQLTLTYSFMAKCRTCHNEYE